MSKSMAHNRTMATIDHSTVYYLPGYGGQLATGLGQGLIDRGFHVAGRETRDDFLKGYGITSSMSRRGNCWDTQSKITSSAASGLTRAGIGVMPLC
jgi:transposase InsO family protein